jgi:hypothetical protein
MHHLVRHLKSKKHMLDGTTATHVARKHNTPKVQNPKNDSEFLRLPRDAPEVGPSNNRARKDASELLGPLQSFSDRGYAIEGVINAWGSDQYQTHFPIHGGTHEEPYIATDEASTSLQFTRPVIMGRESIDYLGLADSLLD